METFRNCVLFCLPSAFVYSISGSKAVCVNMCQFPDQTHDSFPTRLCLLFNESLPHSHFEKEASKTNKNTPRGFINFSTYSRHSSPYSFNKQMDTMGKYRSIGKEEAEWEEGFIQDHGIRKAWGQIHSSLFPDPVSK